MANGLVPILGEGSILTCFNEKVVQLLPTIYMFYCTINFISLDTLLKVNCLYVQNAEGYIHIIDNCTIHNIISFHSHGENIMYWVRAPKVHDITSMNINIIAIDYELFHHQLGHPSRVILRAACKHVKDIPSMTIHYETGLSWLSAR